MLIFENNLCTYSPSAASQGELLILKKFPRFLQYDSSNCDELFSSPRPTVIRFLRGHDDLPPTHRSPASTAGVGKAGSFLFVSSNLDRRLSEPAMTGSPHSAEAEPLLGDCPAPTRPRLLTIKRRREKEGPTNGRGPAMER